MTIRESKVAADVLLRKYKENKANEADQKEFDSKQVAILKELIKQTETLASEYKEKEDIGYFINIKESLGQTLNFLMNKEEPPCSLGELLTHYQLTTKSENGNLFKFIVQNDSKPGSEPLDSQIIKGEMISLLKEIIDNCIANADSFTKQGNISVTIQYMDPEHGSIGIIIADNDPGMSSKEIN